MHGKIWDLKQMLDAWIGFGCISLELMVLEVLICKCKRLEKLREHTW
jgi:hypothetical protein